MSKSPRSPLSEERLPRKFRATPTSSKGLVSRKASDETTAQQRDMVKGTLPPLEHKQQRSVSDLQLFSRIERSLLRHGIRTIEVLITWSRRELLAEVVGLGESSVDHLEEALTRHNLSLATDVSCPAALVRTPLTNARHIRNHQRWLG